MLDALRGLLEGAGYNVHAASSSDEALETAARVNPCAALVDALTPSVNTPALAAQLGKGVPLVIVPVGLRPARPATKTRRATPQERFLLAPEALLEVVKDLCGGRLH